jgi:hypothetical protein
VVVKPWVGAIGALWLACAASGIGVLWRWDNTPGESARAPREWPAASALARAAERPTLVVLAHPKCTCTRASVAELAEVLARADRRPKTYVLFMKPASFADGWETTDLWRTAATLPDVTVVRDDDGREAQRFGAATSGQTLLYDERGRLVFNGGVTGARAHAGDNLGRRSLVSLLNRGSSQPAAPPRGGHDTSTTGVFGCPLFNPGT